jgi:RNA polymerase sigma factor (TIGR02999 family)
MTARSGNVSFLLSQWSKGDAAARNELIPLVYGELRKLAAHHLGKERPEHSLQVTGLVNEAYLRLVDQRDVRWQNRAHFFALSSQMMRRVLVDHARRRKYAKRGHGAQQISLDEAMIVSPQKAPEIVALDEALTRLAQLDPRKCQVVELKYFGGMTNEEIAEVLNVSAVTVRRDWTTAKAWLYRAINETPGAASNGE